MECTLQVGDKVVCLGRPPGEPDKRGHGTEARPTRGSIYTVREFVMDPADRGLCIRLAEIVNPALFYAPPWGQWEPAWEVHHFRPLVTTKTDISLFQKILEEASKEAKEKV